MKKLTRIVLLTLAAVLAPTAAMAVGIADYEIGDRVSVEHGWTCATEKGLTLCQLPSEDRIKLKAAGINVDMNVLLGMVDGKLKMTALSVPSLDSFDHDIEDYGHFAEATYDSLLEKVPKDELIDETKFFNFDYYDSSIDLYSGHGIARREIDGTKYYYWVEWDGYQVFIRVGDEETHNRFVEDFSGSDPGEMIN